MTHPVKRRGRDKLGAGLAAIALVAAAPSGAAAAEGAACTMRGHRIYSRVADLPPGVTAAVGTSLAERGEPWNPTDVFDLSHPLPNARFIWARRSACRLEIRYEQGGLARFYMTAVLVLRGREWVVVRQRYG